MSTRNFMDPGSKDNLLGVVGKEVDGFLHLVANPARWEAPTACDKWQVRDVAAHLVDTTEGYLANWKIGREGGTAPEPHGLRPMADLVDEGAKAFRKVPQEELVERLHDDWVRMRTEFEALTPEEWTGLLIPHNYMGPLPAMFYPVFQLVDYAVHTWDIRQGLGEPHGISGDAADYLVPVIHILWQATADTSGVTEPFSVGIRTSGPSGGDVRFDVTPEGVQYAAGDIEDCAAIIEFDPASLVLTGYARINGGTVRGDAVVASRFRSLFFPI
jgi:uncharacterized protein (TIGR03083 family)